MYISDLMVNESKFQFSVPILLPGSGKRRFVFQFQYCKLSVKNQWGRDRRPNFVIFLVWRALIAGGWVMVAWSKNSCLLPCLLSSFVFLGRNEGKVGNEE